MICPRCSVAEISEDSHQCVLCGFTPTASVVVDEPAHDEVRDAVQAALADDFRIQAVLRLGERTFVYLAYETASDRLVALKVMPLGRVVDADLARRFHARAAEAAALHHAHIVPVYRHGVARTFVWYAMEHVKGRSWADVLREGGPMDVGAALQMLDQVAGALDHAHRKGVFHGNLKPTNIFVDSEKWVRVSDFAVLDAFGREAGAAADGPRLRLPEYMAPEQFYARSAGASADQYAFGLIAYQCLTGSLPFVGDSFEEVARLQANEPPRPIEELRPDVSPHVAQAIHRALSKLPGERFPTVMDCAASMSAGGEPRPSMPVVKRPSMPAPVLFVRGQPRGVPWRRVGLAALFLAAVGLSWWAWDRIGPAMESDVPSEQEIELPLPQARTPETSTGLGNVPSPLGAPRSTPTRATGSRPTATAEPGLLFVNARPWGELYIDGRLVGNTPRANLSLPPGSYRIRVTRDGFVPFERTVVVGSGDTIRLTDIELAPQP